MAFDTFTRLLDQFPSLEELQLQGLGEPMMHPRLFDMFAYASRRVKRVSTNSNMTLLNPTRAARCVTSGLHELHVSIDGATAATYERIRMRSNFARVIRNVELLQGTKRRLGSDTPWLRMVVVAMRQNLDEFPDLVRLAHRLGIDTVFVQHLCHDFGESSLPSQYLPMRDFVADETLLTVDAGRIGRAFAAARAAADELGVDLRLPNPRPKLHPPGTPGPERCDWPWRGAYVSYDGRAMPCCMVATPDRINFGNMVDYGAATVWNNAEYHEFRERLDSDDPPDVCRSCSVYRGTF
jgi:radical SAM protein with 4Fe4S-binding SPASM domain